MTWIIITLLLALAMIAGGVVLRSWMTGAPLPGGIFAAKPEKRLAVMEQANVDGRRRLILIRRDNVEHLIMTGGPVDLVVETGIGAAAPLRPRLTEAAEPTTPVFTRAPRSIGQQAAGE